VGSVIGQLAKLSGCRAVGIAGGAKKCAYAVKELGFDACVDHADPACADLLKKACPRGIDVYFENVGGKIFDTILPLLNLRARVPVCGLIAHYNVADQAGTPSGFNTLLFTLIKRLRIEGFIIYDHYAAGLFDPFFQRMKVLVAEGKVKPHEYVIEGLEHAPQGLAGLLEGKNFGKVVVRVVTLETVCQGVNQQAESESLARAGRQAEVAADRVEVAALPVRAGLPGAADVHDGGPADHLARDPADPDLALPGARGRPRDEHRRDGRLHGRVQDGETHARVSASEDASALLRLAIWVGRWEDLR